MPTKTEKGIHLDFPAGWEAVKYDGDTKEDNAGFYRTRIEHRVQHVRGVDIVALATAPANRLLLIEVKDYRVSASSAEREAKILRQTVIQKALNTVSGLYAATRVGDAELRPVVAKLLKAELTIEVVLLLEQPLVGNTPQTTAQKLRKQNPQTGINDLRLELTSILRELGFDFHLRTSSTMQLRDEWSVRLA